MCLARFESETCLPGRPNKALFSLLFFLMFSKVKNSRQIFGTSDSLRVGSILKNRQLVVPDIEQCEKNDD